MGDKSAIEWTDATWNPTTGCDRVSPGCDHCYALTLAARMKKMGSPAYQNDGDPRTSGPGFKLTLHPDRLEQPLRWSRPRRIFVNSMSDLFHPDVPDNFIGKVFHVMAAADRHQFQVLTKRPQRMAQLLSSGSWGLEPIYGWPLSNVWLGTSIESQKYAFRAKHLIATPAAIRFLSCEPLLGPLSFRWASWAPLRDANHLDGLRMLDWIIVGGESGANARSMEVDWVRALRDQCVSAGVPFFFKQWGGRTPKAGGRELDGRTWDEYPDLVGVS